MKKSIFLVLATILCATNAWAWCGNSFITVNGLWCTGSNSYVHDGGKFDGKDLGTLTALELGGELQVWPSSEEAATMYYSIDNAEAVAISLPKTGMEGGSNSKHSGSATVDLSALAAGEHTLAVWFNHGSDWDSNDSKNFVATFTTLATPVYKDVTVTVTIPYALNGNTPKIYWWGADGVEDAVWEEAPEMTPDSWSTVKFSYTFEQIDSVRGINYLIICDGVQTKDLYTQKDAAVWFASNMPEVKVMGINSDWTEGMETSVSSDCKSAKVMVQLPENTTNEFKLAIDGAWKGNATITADNNVATLTDEGNNATIESTKAGGYVFSYSYVTGELTVIYPGDYTLDLGELAPYYGYDGVQLEDDNYNAITIYNLQDEEYKYGEEFEAEASIKHNGEWLTLTGKASWTLADGVMTLVATNMVDEDNSVNYTITATALAPQEYTIVCNGTYEEEVTEYYTATKYTATTEDEDVIVIEIGTYGEETSVSGQFNDNWFASVDYTITEGEDGVKVLNATAIDEVGNTYIITMTATKAVYPEINIYNATVVSMEEGSLVLSASHEGKAVSFELYQNGRGELNAMLEIGVWEEEGYMSCMSTAPALEEEDGDYTVTGIFTDDFDNKYIITITNNANPTTGLDNVTSTVAPVKVIENNQLIIIKNGVRYNVMGATVK